MNNNNRLYKRVYGFEMSFLRRELTLGFYYSNYYIATGRVGGKSYTVSGGYSCGYTKKEIARDLKQSILDNANKVED